LSDRAPVHDRSSTRTWLLTAVLVLLLLRLGWYAVDFGQRSLQMDFSAFWAAGRAVDAGLSPYVNHVTRNPPIWDGIDTYRHSRFLYPPLVARAFQPLGRMPYHEAKFVWMLLSLAALAGALALAARQVGIERSLPSVLALAILVAAFFPVLTLIERGQNDSVTLLLLLGAIGWTSSGPRRSLASGALLAAATWLKLHCVFLIPFVLLRRRWRVLVGFFAASGALVLIGLIIDGPQALTEYLRRELPRIARYGERGSREMRLPAQTLQPLVESIASGRTLLDGRTYDVEAFQFVLNGSLVRTPIGRATWSTIRSVGVPIAPGHVSLVFFAVGLAGCIAWQRRFGPPGRGDRSTGNLIYWQSALVVVLLCAPVTWAMGVVWLLPVGAIVLREMKTRAGRLHALSLGACVAGLTVAAVPDRVARVFARPFFEPAIDYRYIVAELLCLAGLAGLWSVRGTRPAAPRAGETRAAG